MPVNGLNNALIPIVSFNYGARQRSRITGVIHFALVLSAAIMAVGTVVFLAIPGPLLRLFDADAAVLAEGISALRLIALSFVCAGVSVILCAALQALGAANSSLVVSLLRQLVLLFPLALLLGALRPSLVWLAFLCPRGPPASPPCCSTAAPHGAGWPVWRNKCPLPTGPEAAASRPVFSFKRDFDPTLLTV